MKMMTHIGLLPEDTVRKNIDRLIKLTKIRKDLANKIPTDPLSKSCLPIQKAAVREEIRAIMRYLRKWNVNIKACINNEN